MRGSLKADGIHALQNELRQAPRMLCGGSTTCRSAAENGQTRPVVRSVCGSGGGCAAGGWRCGCRCVRRHVRRCRLRHWGGHFPRCCCWRRLGGSRLVRHSGGCKRNAWLLQTQALLLPRRKLVQRRSAGLNSGAAWSGDRHQPGWRPENLAVFEEEQEGQQVLWQGLLAGLNSGEADRQSATRFAGKLNTAQV